MDKPDGVPRIPEVLISKLEELEEGRDGWLEDGPPGRKEASRALGPPVLLGEVELDDKEASELNLLFHRFKERPVCKDRSGSVPSLLLSPRTLQWKGADRAYVEFNILGVL